MRNLRGANQHQTLSVYAEGVNDFGNLKKGTHYAFIFILRSVKKFTGPRRNSFGTIAGFKHVPFQRNMYNRLLFDCPELQDDVIFATVSNQCPQRPPVRETLPALKLQQKV